MIPFPINEESSDKFPINEETSDKISDKLHKIIVYMQGNSGVVTQAEIAKMFGVSDRQARNYLSLLLNEGKICATANAKDDPNRNQLFVTREKIDKIIN